SEKKSRLALISLAAMVAAFFVFVPGWSAAIGAARPTSPTANCAGTSVGFLPLTDMGNNIYHGYKGGLYPNAQDVPPPAYLQDGLSHAAHVQPRNSNGQPDPTNGRIVLLSIGMSNTTME